MTMQPERQDLRLWVLYDHPRDVPDSFIARLHLVTAGGLKPTASYVKSAQLEMVRGQMKGMGLTCLTRDPTDDPCIVETWL